MENRDRDKVSGNTSQQSGKKPSDVDFGKNIGRSEDLEEPDRESDIGSSGRSSSSGDRSQSGSMGSDSSRRPSGGDEQ